MNPPSRLLDCTSLPIGINPFVGVPSTAAPVGLAPQAAASGTCPHGAPSPGFGAFDQHGALLPLGATGVPSTAAPVGHIP
jgi:hypothetical protein